MKKVVKNLMIYSIVGIMQIGFGTSMLEASPLNTYEPQQIQLNGRDHRGHDNDRRHEHDERMRRENERHEREMRRHHGESERAWHERQERERHRHDEEMREIGALLIGIAIGASNN